MVFYGTSTRVQELMTFASTCKTCQRNTVHSLRRRQKKGTLYFVPLVPISSKYYAQCNVCGATADISKERAQELQQRWAAWQKGENSS